MKMAMPPPPALRIIITTIANCNPTFKFRKIVIFYNGRGRSMDKRTKRGNSPWAYECIDKYLNIIQLKTVKKDAAWIKKY